MDDRGEDERLRERGRERERERERRHVVGCDRGGKGERREMLRTP